MIWLQNKSMIPRQISLEVLGLCCQSSLDYPLQLHILVMASSGCELIQSRGSLIKITSNSMNIMPNFQWYLFWVLQFPYALRQELVDGWIATFFSVYSNIFFFDMILVHLFFWCILDGGLFCLSNTLFPIIKLMALSRSLRIGSFQGSVTIRDRQTHSRRINSGKNSFRK